MSRTIKARLASLFGGAWQHRQAPEGHEWTGDALGYPATLRHEWRDGGAWYVSLLTRDGLRWTRETGPLMAVAWLASEACRETLRRADAEAA